MNISQNSSNSTENIDLWEILMFKIGSSWALDTIYLYIITPLGFLGVISNIISAFVLFKISETHAIYKYYQVYTANGILICTIIMLNFYTRTPRYFDFSLTHGAGVYRCQVLYGSYTLALFGNLINISILLERLSNFKRSLKYFFKDRPYLIVLISWLITFVINLPTFFIGIARNDEEFKEALKSYEKLKDFYYCKRLPFVNTVLGSITLFLITLIRDFIFTIIELILTFISYLNLKKFIENKKILTNNVDSVKSQGLSRKRSCKAQVFPNKSSTTINQRPTNNTQQKAPSFSNLNRKLQVMSLSFASLSVFSNLTSLINSLIYILLGNNNLIFHWLALINILFFNIRYILNFFLFYIFNKNFRAYLKKLFH
jgi:hypothetical protein